MIESMEKEDGLRSYLLRTGLIALAILLVVIYASTFSLIHQQIGETGGIIILAPVILLAWVLGARIGMLAGLIIGLINFLLHGFTFEHGFLEYVFIFFSGIITVVIGWITGRFTELRISSLLFGIDFSADMSGRRVAELVRNRTQEMIERERNLLRTVIDNLPDKIYVKDTKSHYILNNIVHLQSLGLSKQEDTLGKTAFNFFPEQFAKQFTADEQNIIETGESLTNREEEVFDSKTGKINWHLTTKIPIKDSNGKIIGLVGISRDITEHKLAEIAGKQAEEAIRQSEKRFRAVVEQSVDAIFITDPESLQIINSNHAFQKMLGYSPEESHLLKIEEIVIAPALKIRESLTSIIATHRPLSDEWRCRRKDGSLIDVVISANRVTFSGKQLVCTFARDITEWKLLQQEREKLLTKLGDSEHKFRTLFENLTEGVALHEVIYDENGKALDYRILDINPSFERQTGLVQEKVKGSLASATYGAEALAFFKEFEHVARTGEPVSFEKYFSSLERHFRIGVISPKQGTFATVFEDITERIQKQKELQDKNAELERFTYTVSHDLKSPLITIKGFAGALLHDVIAGRHQRLESDLQRIADAADKMGGLLGNLLELSRIGRIMNPPSDVNMVELAQEVVALLAGSIAEHKVEVVIQPDLPMVYGDQRRLAQVLQNLIENAVKFMGNQPNPRIEIGIRKDNEEQVIYVQDNGIGVDPHYHDTVFGLFNKLDAGSHGTGIGLALVRRIVEIHGGRIWLESQGKGFGATFCFTLSSNHTTRKENGQ
jgi:PAS domain S-box-containing protein